MSELLSQLDHLLLSAIPAGVLLCVVWLAHRWIMHGKMVAVLSERRERTQGDMSDLRLAPSLSAQRAGILLKLKTKLALVLLVSFVVLSADLTFAAEANSEVAPVTSPRAVASQSAPEPGGLPPLTAKEEEHGLTQKAVEVTRLFGLPITNSMIVSWVVALGLIIFAQAATYNMKQVPAGAQNFLEWLVEGLYKFLEEVIGRHLVEKTFWFFATIFILTANWVGLIPGVGSVGWGHQTSHGFQIDQPWLRGANADVNMTFAMALVFFACWIVWALQEVGPLGFLTWGKLIVSLRFTRIEFVHGGLSQSTRA